MCDVKIIKSKTRFSYIVQAINNTNKYFIIRDNCYEIEVEIVYGYFIDFIVKNQVILRSGEKEFFKELISKKEVA